jgi:sedoheptulokinase
MIVSIDLGTSKLCAVAVDHGTARPLAIRSCPNDTHVPRLSGDLHEQDPVRTRELCFELIRQVLRDEAVAGQPVDAIGISGQMHGVVLVGRDLRPVTNLITWRDRRTAREDTPGSISESLALLDADAEQRTGCRLAVGYGAATLRWIERNGLMPADCTALTIAGYIAASLSGVVAIDETHAASWGIFDVSGNEWDRECVSRLGIRAGLLPEIRLSGQPLGELTDSARETLGVEGRAIVCSPVGDCQASVIGSAGFSTDTIVLNLGTGGQISIPSIGFAYTEELDAWPMPFGGYLQLGAALCGGWAYAYLKQFFGQIVHEICGVELSDEAVYERMNALAASASPDAGGLVADTRFSGTRKDKSAKGCITGIDTTNLTPANLSLAVLEGIVRDLHSMWLTSGSRHANRLIASGNAVRRNPVLRSVIGRAFDVECLMSSLPEEAARGAGYAAAVGAGIATREEITALVRKSAHPLVAG